MPKTRKSFDLTLISGGRESGIRCSLLFRRTDGRGCPSRLKSLEIALKGVSVETLAVAQGYPDPEDGEAVEYFEGSLHPPPPPSPSPSSPLPSPPHPGRRPPPRGGSPRHHVRTENAKIGIFPILPHPTSS